MCSPSDLLLWKSSHDGVPSEMTTTAIFIQRPSDPDISKMQRIAVFRALQLGDMLCVVPALRALRAAAPNAHITLIGLPWAAGFVERFSRYVDDLLIFPGFPGFPEREVGSDAMPCFLEEAQQRHFDLVIQMHGSGKLSNSVVGLLGARHIAGYFESGQYCPDPQRFIEWEEGEHEVLRYVRLMEFLGAASRGEATEFPLFDTDYQALRQSHDELPRPGTYVCVHPGARLPSRRWFPQRFAQVADHLAGSGLKVVITGSEEERSIAAAVIRSMHAPALDLSGKTSLGALAALVAQARLVVCNDTGISHVAAAVATPSVIVCCGSDPARWAPLDSARHCVVGASVACRPCMHFSCPIGHHCAQIITAETVSTIATHVLAAHKGNEAEEISQS
jgi:ADP-heptose:LPS heptosyltransferase